MNEYLRCESCQEPTKRPAGFWDGADQTGETTGGFIYDCQNHSCPTRQSAIEEKEEKARRQAVAREANQKNGVSAVLFKSARWQARVTLKEAADMARISSATMSAYEKEREPFPPELYHELTSGFLSRHIIEPSEDKHGHVRTLLFIGTKDGAAEDLYRTQETGAVLCRQCLDDNLVRWNTTCGSGYEADCPVKDGMTLKVIDKTGKEIFTETTYRTVWNGAGQADKAHPFSWEGL